MAKYFGGGAGSIAPGDKVSVDSSDTTSGFLSSKLVAGSSISLTVLNPGASESLRIDLLTAFEITNFTKTGGAIVLLGASIANPTFNAVYNQPAIAVSLTDTEGNNDVIALPGTAFISPHTFTKTVYGSTVVFTDHATGPAGTGSATANFTLSWGNNVYFGSAIDPGVVGYNSAFANSLTASLKLAPAGTYAYNTGAGQSAFFCTRSAFGLAPTNFTVSSFPFACSKVASNVPVTNTNGITENYDFFRSDNMALSAFNLVES